MNNVNSSQCLKLKFCVSLVDNVTVDTSDECYRQSHKAQKDEEYKDVDSKHRDLVEGKSTICRRSHWFFHEFCGVGRFLKFSFFLSLSKEKIVC